MPRWRAGRGELSEGMMGLKTRWSSHDAQHTNVTCRAGNCYSRRAGRDCQQPTVPQTRSAHEQTNVYCFHAQWPVLRRRQTRRPKLITTLQSVRASCGAVRKLRRVTPRRRELMLNGRENKYPVFCVYAVLAVTRGRGRHLSSPRCAFQSSTPGYDVSPIGANSAVNST